MFTEKFTAAVLPTDSASGRTWPVDAAGVRVTGGFWRSRLDVNRTRTLPHGARQLRRANNLANFEALIEGGEYRAGRDDSGAAFPFLDSDVYKWLEAAAWELGEDPDAATAAAAEEMIDLIERAQRADGYLNTYVQLTTPGREFDDLQWAHELYSAGHLIQAAVAWHRSLGDDRLLTVASRCADRIDREFGPDGRPGTDGHPELEMALVELYRVTGSANYLDLAVRLIDVRGQGLLGAGRFGPQYWQDHAPVALADHPTGHAVRQLYLDCGAVDVAVETGDQALLDAVIRRWEHMVRDRTYITGALGSHHRDESFGDPYELPPDRAYAETCAAIASVMLSWRLLLATGQARFADLAERTLYNAVLPGIALDGTHFFYVNPLQRRSGHEHEGPGASSAERAEWFACACCPPNLMRLFGSWPQQLVTRAGGLDVQQYASSVISTELDGRPVRLDMRTDYPWDGTVTITLDETPRDAWPLRLRMPAWAVEHALELNGEPVAVEPVDGYLCLERTWAAGDTIVLRLEMPVRALVADRRIDAVRGCVAVQRGPLLYCLEQADLPDGVAVEDVELDTATLEVVTDSPVADLPVTVRADVAGLDRVRPPWPYAEAERAGADRTAGRPRWKQDLVPYFAWANRVAGPMRVWIPRA